MIQHLGDMASPTQKQPFKTGVFLCSLSTWGLFALVVVSCLLIIGLGYWIGYLRLQSGVKDPNDPLNTAVGYSWQTSGKIEKSLVMLEALHIQIWNQAASLAKEDMDSELRSLFVNAVNDLISLYLERKTIALVYRIPDAVWERLLLLTGIGMFAFGYQSGNNGLFRIFQNILVPVAFGMIIVLIADLDSTMKQRRFKVTKQPLLDVQEMMYKGFV